jgi:hypothetical protein
VSGETTAEMVERLPQQLQRVPGFDFVFILGGSFIRAAMPHTSTPCFSELTPSGAVCA